MDFRLLNAYFNTWKTWLLGTLGTILKVQADWRIYTSIDLSQGCFHIFVCDMLKGLFDFESNYIRCKYNCLPQGWPFSASAFHSRMRNILKYTTKVVYVDDFLMGGKKKKEHGDS